MYKINDDEIKLLISDVDGTLFNGKYEPININDKKVLEEFLKEGNYFILNTGNLAFVMLPALKMLVGDKLNDFTKYIITSNGNIIDNLLEGTTHVTNTFEYDLLLKYVDLFNENNWRFDITGEEGKSWYFSTEEDRLKNIEFTGVSRDHIFVLDDKNIQEIQHSPKFTLYGLNPELREEITKKIKDLSDKVKVTWWNERALDISIGTINKFNGIVSLLKMINEENNTNWTLDNVIYFGDQHNDVEVFQNHKYSIAMGNATDEIKNLAFEITDTAANGGVWRYMEKIIQ